MCVLIVWTSLFTYVLYVVLQLQDYCLAPRHSCHNAEGRLCTVNSSNSIWLGTGKVLKVDMVVSCSHVHVDMVI